MLEQGNIVTLKNNKKYTIVDSKYLDNTNYLCLIDQDDFYNLIFCKYNTNNTLTEIKDDETVNKLIELFNKSLNKEQKESYGYTMISIVSILTGVITLGVLMLVLTLIK